MRAQLGTRQCPASHSSWNSAECGTETPPTLPRCQQLGFQPGSAHRDLYTTGEAQEEQCREVNPSRQVNSNLLPQRQSCSQQPPGTQCGTGELGLGEGDSAFMPSPIPAIQVGSGSLIPCLLLALFLPPPARWIFPSSQLGQGRTWPPKVSQGLLCCCSMATGIVPQTTPTGKCLMSDPRDWVC